MLTNVWSLLLDNERWDVGTGSDAILLSDLESRTRIEERFNPDDSFSVTISPQNTATNSKSTTNNVTTINDVRQLTALTSTSIRKQPAMEDSI